MSFGLARTRRVGSVGERGGWGGRFRPRQMSLAFAAQAFVALACVTLLSLAGYDAWSERASRLREAQNANANLARALAQHAEDTFGIADAMLVGLVGQFERAGSGPAAIAGIERLMTAQVTESERVGALFLVGEDGGLLASSLTEARRGRDDSGRAHFRHHRDDRDRGAFLGLPIRAAPREGWAMTVSRRLQHPDGRFAGVVLAGIPTEVFTDYYGRFDIGSQGTVALLRTDGMMLSRHPFDEAQLGRSFAAQPFFRDQLPRGPLGSYHFVSPIDGVEKVAGYHSGRSFPVVVNVASAVEEVLAGWAAETATRLAGVALVAALLGGLGARLARQARRRQEAERALGESELQFRLLTEMSADMVTRVQPDGVRTYVSPASARLLGWAPRELLGTRALTAVHPDDREAATEQLAAMAAGTLRDNTLSYRTWHRDGREIWIESSVRVTRDPDTDAPSGAVVVSRDVTARKVVEMQLATLATTDGLTGIANRRRLDEALASEWRRAARDGTAVSLALADVDHFKPFNDRHGHGAGDECLRGVAAALAGTVRRPADLVARYGGEELAALLPDTDAVGAGAVAEGMRAAVEALGIAHGDSPPAGMVTVSVGVATVTPAGGEDPAAGVRALLAAADGALYEAKRTGRNRVVVSAHVVALRKDAGAIGQEQPDRLLRTA